MTPAQERLWQALRRALLAMATAIEVYVREAKQE